MNQRRKRTALILDEKTVMELSAIVRSRTGSVGTAKRAKILLLFSQGVNGGAKVRRVAD
jgi:hypothetical protein